MRTLEQLRPLCSIDVETTGPGPNPDAGKDRIVQIGYTRFDSEARAHVDQCLLVNPGCAIAPRTTEIHGITDEMVKDAPTFVKLARALLGEIGGCDLLGFNIHNYDLPVLWEEFYRAGITWVIDFNVIDVGSIFKKMQPRTLEAAFAHYMSHTMVNAHNAMADAIATMHIYQAMLSRHADLTAMGRQQLALFSHFDQRIDLAGKLVLIGGKPCYGFGKLKGTPIEDDIGYARWMLDKDFSWNTKMHLRELLACILRRDQHAPLFERDEPGEPFSSPLDENPH